MPGTVCRDQAVIEVVSGLSGAVLAGGASRRMGRDKATIDDGSGPWAAVVAGVLDGAGCDPIWLVGGPPAHRAELAVTSGARFIADRWPGEGPLGGTLTALAALTALTALTAGPVAGGGIVVAACDLTELDAATVAAVAAAGSSTDHRAAVAVAGGRWQQSLCWWSRDAVAEVQAAFDAGERSLRAALETVDAVGVEVDPARLRNRNRPD